MGHFSVKTLTATGSVLSDIQQSRPFVLFLCGGLVGAVARLSWIYSVLCPDRLIRAENPDLAVPSIYSICLRNLGIFHHHRIPFRHAQDHQYPPLRLPRILRRTRGAAHGNPCPPPAGNCPEAEKIPAVASDGRSGFLGPPVLPMGWLAPFPGNRQARDRHRLAPQGVQAFLDMEVAAGKARPASGIEGDPQSDPMDVSGQHIMGCASDSWRAFEAWLFHLPSYRLEIHGLSPLATIAVVADIPYKSCRLPGIDRLFRGPHGHVPTPVRVHRAPPRPPPDRAFRRHCTSDRGLGSRADPRSLSVGHGAAVPNPRPGRRIRAIVPFNRDGDGRGRGRHRATKPVAKSVCGTPDRQREARMPRPRDHPQRAAFAAYSWLIHRLLSRFEDPLVARQGHTGWTARSARRFRTNRLLAQGWWPASSLRASRGLTISAGLRSISLCGNVDAAGIRMPLHSVRWHEPAK